MSEHDWHTTYTDAVQRFGGDTPGAALEQQILDAFQEAPQLVIRAIDKVAAKYTAGRVNSPWGAMKHEIQRATNQPHLIAVDSTGRDRAIQRAEQWIRAAGIHYDRDSEIMLELFSGSGLLAAYAHVDLIPDDTDTGKWKISEPTGDIALVERMLKVYNDARPTGIQIEEDTTARAEKYRAQQAELRAALAKAQEELAAKQPVTVPPNDDLPF